MELEKIKQSIYKTGFVHEFKVCKILEENGWNVINNRYYLDDVQEINREIDIISYKVHEIDEVLYYTSLIISCKKSDSNIWSFLTKNAKKSDPNINFCPIWNWSNDRILEYMIQPIKLESRVWELAQTHTDLHFIYGINDQIFAFQQIQSTNYTPQNDKDIYNSIISSIKALEYEKNSLNKRVKMKALYNFNLISIFDGKMVKVHFNDNEETLEEIDEIKYLNRHIVNRNENFYRVHFMKYNKLSAYIKHLNELHDWNIKFYPTLKEEFYDGITHSDNTEKLELLIPDFKKEVYWFINHLLDDYVLDEIALEYETTKKTMLIGVSGKDTSYETDVLIAKQCNDEEKIIEHVKNALKKIYHYNGEVEFIDYTSVGPLPF